MGRKAGSLMRCTCRACGAVAMLRGCNNHYFCDACALTRANWYYRAHGAVTRAVKRGELRPAREHICVDCGKQASDWEHRDYTKPLDVQPVCHSCNLKRGPAITRMDTDTPCTGEPATAAIAVIADATSAQIVRVAVVDFYAR